MREGEGEDKDKDDKERRRWTGGRGGGGARRAHFLAHRVSSSQESARARLHAAVSRTQTTPHPERFWRALHQQPLALCTMPAFSASPIGRAGGQHREGVLYVAMYMLLAYGPPNPGSRSRRDKQPRRRVSSIRVGQPAACEPRRSPKEVSNHATPRSATHCADGNSFAIAVSPYPTAEGKASGIFKLWRCTGQASLGQT